MEILKPDICVIGAGAGGLSLAAGAARLGASVVLIEKARMGGDCLNHGCVPSKALLAVGAAAQAVREAGRFGVQTAPPQIEWARAQAHVRATIAAIAPNDSVARYRALGVQVIEGAGRFVARNSVEAAGARGAGARIEARRFVIATGSRPGLPNIPGLELIRFRTNEDIFDLPALPKRLAIIGAGAVALEMAQAFCRLGANVLVLARRGALSREDPEIADIIVQNLRREGVAFRMNAAIARAEPNGAQARLVLADGESVEADCVLVATGRLPNVGDIGLDAAGVEYDAAGVRTGAHMRTANKRIYAIGDCAGGAHTHTASEQASIALRRILLGLPARYHSARALTALHTDPGFARVGANEREARANGASFRILRADFAHNDRARAFGETGGHIKLIVTPRGKILGCAIVGAHAGELIAPWRLAMDKGLNVSAMAGLMTPYPTLSETSRRAALEFYADKLSSPLGRLGLKLGLRLGRLLG